MSTQASNEVGGRVNRRWALAVVFVGCAAPGVPEVARDAVPAEAPAVAETPEWPWLSGPAIAPARWQRLLDAAGNPVRPATRTPRAAPLDSEWSADSTTAEQLLPAVSGTWDRRYGSALDAAVSDLDGDRAALGVMGIPMELLYGLDGGEPLCEDPRVLVSVTDDGVDWDVQVRVPTPVWLTGLARDTYPMPDSCASVLALGPDGVLGLGCTEADEQAFFPEGSACRRCLETDPWDVCVEADECAPEATRRLHASGGDGVATWFSLVRTQVLFCAPDHVIDATVLVRDLDEGDALPGPFDHSRYEGLCFENWDPSEGATTYRCALSDLAGNAVYDLVTGYVGHVSPAGTETTAHKDRIVAASGFEVEGTTFPLSMAYDTATGAISAPIDAGLNAWGLTPTALRPDGTDPTDPDHTYARDFLGAVAMKTATTRTGVPVMPFNHNRCEAWSEPDADGASTCLDVGPWTGTWFDDGMISWWDPAAGTTYVFPLTTMVSTGLPDPDVPGGFVLHVMGAETLADPEWEACRWPTTFVPDRMALYDTAPVSGEPYASFDGQTFRFDRDPDIRIGLATSHRRDFCVEGG